ncbi:MAG: hypothetical protein HFH39_09490 [Lachnospiraceae bacterium]|nr:hypothetical protein [Lachnospiraceae bacterium]
MKKLRKTNLMEKTIQQYAADCTSCRCRKCGCDCNGSIGQSSKGFSTGASLASSAQRAAGDRISINSLGGLI